jgi:hypothetical protein
MNKIMLFTSTNCKQCEKFKPEWQNFLEEFKPYSHLYKPDFLQQIHYNPNSLNAVEKRAEIFQYAIKGKDGYPLLLFYINGKRWKPYWFDSAIFRTCKSVLFTMLIVYQICPPLWTVPRDIRKTLIQRYWPRDSEVNSKEICHDLCIVDADVDSDVDVKNGIYYMANWPKIKNDMQVQFDELHSAEEQKHGNYPSIDRIIQLDEN